eukprot:UN0907
MDERRLDFIVALSTVACGAMLVWMIWQTTSLALWPFQCLLLVGALWAQSSLWDCLQAGYHHQCCLAQESEQTAALSSNARSARCSWMSAQKEVEAARERLTHVQQEARAVKHDGVTLGSAARIGLHYVGKLTGAPALWTATRAALT